MALNTFLFEINVSDMDDLYITTYMTDMTNNFMTDKNML